MFIMTDEMWNSVGVYGPHPEIERFKRECLSLDPTDDVDPGSPGFDEGRVVWIEADTISEDTWNFRERKKQEPGAYMFAFDTVARFPTALFERLAEMFPSLAFHCECIADNDSSMGFGWFNPPPGGEEFHDGYIVPKGFWARGGRKRRAKAERRHLALVARLKLAGAGGEAKGK